MTHSGPEVSWMMMMMMMWNSLLSKLQQCDTRGEFKRLLNSHLFWRPWHFVTFS